MNLLYRPPPDLLRFIRPKELIREASVNSSHSFQFSQFPPQVWDTFLEPQLFQNPTRIPHGRNWSNFSTQDWNNSQISWDSFRSSWREADANLRVIILSPIRSRECSSMLTTGPVLEIYFFWQIWHNNSYENRILNTKRCFYSSKLSTRPSLDRG